MRGIPGNADSRKQRGRTPKRACAAIVLAESSQKGGGGRNFKKRKKVLSPRKEITYFLAKRKIGGKGGALPWGKGKSPSERGKAREGGLLFSMIDGRTQPGPLDRLRGEPRLWRRDLHRQGKYPVAFQGLKS